MVSPVTVSWIDKINDDLESYYDTIKQFRNYDEGVQASYITEFELELLGGTDTSRINICPTINETEVDRLEVQSIDIQVPSTQMADDNATTRATDKQVSQSITAENWRWWKRSRMDSGQRNAHYSAGRDADSYLIVEYDARLKQPVYSPQNAYDGESGTQIVYLDNDQLKPLFAFKVWTANWSDENNSRVQRANIYLPDRVLKLVNKWSGTGTTSFFNWSALTIEDGQEIEVAEYDLFGTTIKAGRQWWTTDFTEDGDPLGIPVFHLAHSANGMAYGRSNLADVVPSVQDTINIMSMAYTIAARLNSSGRNYMIGLTANNDSVNVNMVPGSILGLPANVTNAGSWPASDLQKIGDGIDRYIRYAAMMTKTPLPILNPSGQIAAEGTLQQMEAPLLAKVRGNQASYGNAYEDAARMALKLAHVVTVEDVPLHPAIAELSIEQIENLNINCVWKNPATRNEREEVEIAVTKVQNLGVPLPQGQREVGYDEDQIQAFEDTQQVEANQQIATLALALQGIDNGNQSSEGSADTTTSAEQSESE